MMDFEIGHRSAKLASPTVALQDRKAELVILLRPKPGRRYLPDAIRLHAAVSLTSAMNLACCSEPATEFASPPASRIFPTRGSAVLRSGWGPDSTVISLRVGRWFNHEHHDEGSFQVAAFTPRAGGFGGSETWGLDRTMRVCPDRRGRGVLLRRIDRGPYDAPIPI